MDGLIVIALLVQFGILALLIGIYAVRTKRVAGNQVLIVSGRGDPVTTRPYRIVIGPGRSFIWPVVERADTLSLEIIRHAFEIANISTADGKSTTFKGLAQFQIKADEEAIVKAVQHLLSKDEAAIKQIAGDRLEQHLRRTTEPMNKETLQKSTAAFAETVQAALEPDLSAIGMHCTSLIVQHVK